MNSDKKTLECPRGFCTKEEILTKYAENIQKCDSCSNLVYDNGILMCKHLMNEERN